MSSRDVSGEISQIDSFLKQLRGDAPPSSTKETDEFQQSSPVVTTAPPHGSNVARGSGMFGTKCFNCYMC